MIMYDKQLKTVLVYMPKTPLIYIVLVPLMKITQFSYQQQTFIFKRRLTRQVVMVELRLHD
jgi:hypothetical protein